MYEYQENNIRVLKDNLPTSHVKDRDKIDMGLIGLMSSNR